MNKHNCNYANLNMIICSRYCLSPMDVVLNIMGIKDEFVLHFVTKCCYQVKKYDHIT